MKFTAVLASLAVLALVGSAQAHSGRTNASGCHNNRQTGDYHCHNGSSSPSSSPSRRAPSRPSTDGQPSPGNVIDLPDSNSEAPPIPSAPQDELSRLASGVWSVVSVGDGDTIRVEAAGETNYSAFSLH